MKDALVEKTEGSHASGRAPRTSAASMLSRWTAPRSDRYPKAQNAGFTGVRGDKGLIPRFASRKPRPCARTKNTIGAVFLTSVAFGTESRSTAKQIDGDWVARQVEERDRGHDARFEMEMRLYDHRSRETVRRLVLLTRRDDGRDKILVRFTYPGDIRDAAFLANENDTGQDDRFLYLPALGRSRRVSAQEKQDSFVGSDLTYEDISGRRLEDYRYTLLGEETTDGFETYVLESKATSEGVKYPRVVSWVDKERLIVLRGEIYDQTGEKVKEYQGLEIESVDGIWTTTRLVMKDLEHGTMTELQTKAVEYNRGIPLHRFSRNALEQPGVP